MAAVASTRGLGGGDGDPVIDSEQAAARTATEGLGTVAWCRSFWKHTDVGVNVVNQFCIRRLFYSDYVTGSEWSSTKIKYCKWLITKT